MQQYKPGDRIGGEYAVIKVFGGEKQSGMGIVYLVHNRELPDPIILKTFQRAVSEDVKRHFISEAHAWINAGVHANIVRAYWVDEIAGQLFIAAEYIEPDEEGRNNLTHFLNAGQLLPEIILLWAAQFCHGMDYARSKGVLAHRDIKPDNLMIDRTATLKVTDFGLAKSIKEKRGQIYFSAYFGIFSSKKKRNIYFGSSALKINLSPFFFYPFFSFQGRQIPPGAYLRGPYSR